MIKIHWLAKYKSVLTIKQKENSLRYSRKILDSNKEERETDITADKDRKTKLETDR